jgi:hypothetical protein
MAGIPATQACYQDRSISVAPVGGGRSRAETERLTSVGFQDEVVRLTDDGTWIIDG